MEKNGEEEEDGFGDFVFANLNQSPNRIVYSNPTMFNGPNFTTTTTTTDDDGDDDWGDFVVGSGGVDRELSLPITLKPVETVDSGPSRPAQSGSAPSRCDSAWAKPTGALPLSFFGELDEAEELGTGTAAPSSEDKGAGLFDGNKNGGDPVKEDKSRGSVSVSDLIADLYKRGQDENGSRPDASASGFNQRGSDSVERAGTNEAVEHHLKSNELYSGWDWSGANEAKSSTKESDLHWEVVDLNQNGLDSAKQANLSAKAGDFDRDEEDDDDGWEFKAAGSSGDVEEDSSKSKTSQIKTQDGIVSDVNGFNASWSASSSDINGWSWNVNSSTDWSNQSADGNRELANNSIHSKTLAGDENSEVFASSWDFMHSGGKLGSNSSGLNSSGRELNSVSVAENKEFNDSNGWGFKDLEPESKVGNGNYAGDHTRTQSIPVLNFNGSDASWDLWSFKGEGMTKVNGVNSDTKQENLNSLDEIDYTGDEDGWEFKVAGSESNPRDGDAKLELSEEGINRSESNNVASGISNLTGASPKNYEKSVESEFEFDSSASFFTQNGAMDHKIEQKDEQSSTADDRVDSDGDSLNAFPEIKSMDEGTKASLNNHKGALPLSIFGYEEEEIDDPVIDEDISFQMPTSNPCDGIKKPLSNNSINDLISTLYSQAEPVATVSLAQNSSENGVSHEKTATPPNLMNTNDDFDDDSWEFKDASFGTGKEDQASVCFHGESHAKYSTKLEPNEVVDFFSRLKLELLSLAQCHVDSLKKVRSAASGEDDEIHALEKKIQDLHNKLDHNGIISGEHAENNLPGKICLSQFLEVLKEPEFQALESEYQLSKKLSLAESDLTSTMDLLKRVASIVNILTLASKMEQSVYVSTWYKMLSVCAQELEHGGFIWKQAFEKNVHDQMLSEPQAKRHILSLGEIYRIVQVLASSARLYKPWVLASSADPMGLFALLSDCSKLWSSCGLEEALRRISDSAGLKSDESAMTLLESINYIHNLDELMLYDHVFSGQGPICRLSALAAGTVPGMKMVFWNQEQYFLTLANFWANLVTVDPPNLPCIRVGE